MKFKKPYVLYENDALVCEDVSLTQQHCKDECDINLILAKWQSVGSLDHVNHREPKYMDCFEALDFSAALDMVNDAEDRFAALPATIRDRFANDPLKLFSFLSEPENANEAIELGLLPKPQDEVPVVSSDTPENQGL